MMRRERAEVFVDAGSRSWWYRYFCPVGCQGAAAYSAPYLVVWTMLLAPRAVRCATAMLAQDRQTDRS